MAAGLSQAAVAQPEYTRAAVHQVESGRMRPSAGLLALIARRTRRPVSHFLAGPEATVEQLEHLAQLRRLVETQAFAEAVDLGLILLEEKLPQLVEAEARFLVGRSYVRQLDGRSAKPHLLRARQLYELTDNDPAQLADTLGQTASAFYLLEDPRALAVALQALDLCERLQPTRPELTERTLIAVGMVYRRLGDWPRAIECYERALRETEDELGLHVTIRNRAMTLDHLALTYLEVGRWAEAVRNAWRAYRLYHASLDPTDLARAELNLGDVLLRAAELCDARPHLERALLLCRERGLRRRPLGVAALLSVADLQLQSEELEGAETSLAEAAELVREEGEHHHRARTYWLLARLYRERAEFAAADDAFAAASRLLRELSQQTDLLDLLAEHAASLEHQGRITEALSMWRRAAETGRQAARKRDRGWDGLVAVNWSVR